MILLLCFIGGLNILVLMTLSHIHAHLVWLEDHLPVTEHAVKSFGDPNDES